MSRVLFLHCFRKSPGAPFRPYHHESLGIMSTMLSRSGHSTRLLTLHTLDVTSIERSVSSFTPDVIYLLIEGTAVDLSRRVLAIVTKTSSAPVVVGGSFASLMPSTALSMPGVHGVLVGEPENVFPAYVDQLAANPSSPDRESCLGGLYLRADGRLPRFIPTNIVEELDALPFADRELFHPSTTQDEFEVVTSRGCPMSCAYCVNEAVRALYDDPPNYVRRRSPDHICDEIDRICESYPATRRIRFPDHAFALDFDWLDEFTEVYTQRCGLPFSCHVRPPFLDEASADRLAEAGCDLAEIEVVSGSNFIRNEILNMDTSLRHIERAFDLLRERNIRTHAINYVGVPYSTEITELETVRLNQRLAPDLVDVRVYYPFPNTKAAGIAREMGWLSNRGEHEFSEDKSVLDMPALPARTINKLASAMPRDILSNRHPPWLRILKHIPVLPGKTLADVIASLIRLPPGTTVTMRRP